MDVFGSLPLELIPENYHLEWLNAIIDSLETASPTLVFPTFTL